MEIPDKAYITLYGALKKKFLLSLPKEKRNLYQNSKYNLWKAEINRVEGKTYFESAFGTLGLKPKHFYNKLRDAENNIKASESGTQSESFQKEKDNILIFILNEFLEISYPPQIEDSEKLEKEEKARVLLQAFLENYEPNHIRDYPYLKVYDRLTGNISFSGKKNEVGISENEKNGKKEDENPKLENTGSDATSNLSAKTPKSLDDVSTKFFKSRSIKIDSSKSGFVQVSHRKLLLSQLNIDQDNAIKEVKLALTKYYELLSSNNFDEAYNYWVSNRRYENADTFRSVIHKLKEKGMLEKASDRMSEMTIIGSDLLVFDTNLEPNVQTCLTTRIYFEERICLPIPKILQDAFKSLRNYNLDFSPKVLNEIDNFKEQLFENAKQEGITLPFFSIARLFDLTFVKESFANMANSTTMLKVFNYSENFIIRNILDVSSVLENGHWLIDRIDAVTSNKINNYDRLIDEKSKEVGLRITC